jgi:hypothetical protein
LLESRGERALEEVCGVDDPFARPGVRDEVGPQREHDRAPVAGRVGVADGPTDRPLVAHEWIGDPVRRLGQDRKHTPQLAAPFDVDVPRQSADSQVAVLPAEAGQPRQPADVDEQPGLRESKPEQRDQALATGHHLRRVAVLREQTERLVERGWASIVKRGRKHGSPPDERNQRRPRRSSPGWVNLTTRSGDSAS